MFSYIWDSLYILHLESTNTADYIVERPGHYKDILSSLSEEFD